MFVNNHCDNFNTALQWTSLSAISAWSLDPKWQCQNVFSGSLRRDDFPGVRFLFYGSCCLQFLKVQHSIPLEPLHGVISERFLTSKDIIYNLGFLHHHICLILYLNVCFHHGRFDILYPHEWLSLDKLNNVRIQPLHKYYWLTHKDLISSVRLALSHSLTGKYNNPLQCLISSS